MKRIHGSCSAVVPDPVQRLYLTDAEASDLNLFMVQLDRTLVRRMAAMSGSVLVDPGSDDEDQLYDNIYVSPSMLNAEGRVEHLDPYVRLSRNLRRTHTPPTFDDYNDNVEQPAGSFEMHSIATSLRQVRPRLPDSEASSRSASPRPSYL